MPIRWTINLDDLKNGTHTVVTKEGARRTGKITDIVYTTQHIYGQEVKTPKQVILNNDSADYIEWDMIASINTEKGANVP